MKKRMTFLGVILWCLPTSAAVIYVDADAKGAGNGQSWTDAYTSLSTAITSATTGDEVWVAEGVYRPIVLKSGVKVYGGFAGTESAASASDPVAHRTIISGGGTRRAVRSLNDDASTVLRGFVIKDGMNRDWTQAGGGMYLHNSSAVFAFCDFRDNSAVFGGGAVAIYGGGSPTFVNCRFLANGGGNGRPTPAGGGAVFNRNGSPTFANCLFHGNTGGDGGAIVTLEGTPRLINCTLSENEATKRRGGAIFDNAGGAVVRNSILWGNRSAKSEAPEIYNSTEIGRSTDVAHSDVQGGWPGQGNINADPKFAGAAASDFRPQSSSPCAGGGVRAMLPRDLADLDWDGDTSEPLPMDLGHSAQTTGTAVDMGAYKRAP